MSTRPTECLSWEWHMECVEAARQAGIKAARDAVANAPWDAENWIAHAQRAADLAAIDVLRGDA